jgi:ribosomal protein S3
MFGMNLLKQRLKTSNITNWLYGYKFHFLGRLSRKQRASSINYIGGKVPLNSLNAKIDYGYFSVPLVNSIVRIKVFLYKDSK